MKKKLIVFLGMVLLLVLAAGCSSEQADSSGTKGTITVVQTSPINMIQMMRNGEIDGFIAWEPFNAQAVKAGNGRYLVQSGEIWPSHPCCVLAASPETDPSADLALVWAHVKATKFIQDPANREKVIKYAMEFTGQDRAVIEEALQHIKYVDNPEEEGFQLYYQNLQEQGFLTKDAKALGYADTADFFKHFISAGTMTEVKQHLAADPSWTPPKAKITNKLVIGYLNQDLHELAVYIARQEGYYHQAGLGDEQLDFHAYQNGVAVMEAFKAHEVSAAYLGGAPAMLKRVNDNIPLYILAGANAEGAAVVVRSDAKIASPADLAGKTIAIPGLGSVQHVILSMFAKKNNLTLQVK